MTLKSDFEALSASSQGPSRREGDSGDSYMSLIFSYFRFDFVILYNG